MTNGTNKGNYRGVNIISFTIAYDFEFFRPYIEETIDHAPEEHLKTVENINILDECPINFPVIATGGYYPPTSEKGAEHLFESMFRSYTHPWDSAKEQVW